MVQDLGETDIRGKFMYRDQRFKLMVQDLEE